MAHQTQLSSLGVSIPIALNPLAKSTTIQITASSGASNTSAFAQYTLDVAGSQFTSTITWANLSSAIVSSVADPGGGVTYTFLSPIAGLRLSSTSATTGTITLKALQSVTA